MSRTTTSIEVRRRRAGIGLACVMVALAFNAGALVLADWAAGSARPALALPAPNARPAMLMVVPRPTKGEARASTAATADKRAAPTRARVESARRAAATALPGRLARVEEGGSEEVALRFYRLGELDEPAEPASEWSIDVDALDALGVDRIAFELLIDDRGEIIRCSLAEPFDLSAEIRHKLETRLQETTMRPAVREGIRVASYRRIELYADVSNPSEPMPSGAPLILSSVIADR